MRHRRLTLGTAALAAGVVAVPVLAPTFATGDGSDQTIHLRAVNVETTELDLGEEGLGPGDQLAFAYDLFRADDGRRTGESGGSCTFVRLTQEGASANCTATLALGRGQVTLQTYVTFAEEPAPFTVAVTGGTGRYQGVGGEMTIEPLTETEDRYTLRLRYPRR